MDSHLETHPYQSLFRILFFDIETVPVQYRFEELSPKFQELFGAKMRFQLRDNPDKSIEQWYGERAGILAEFARVVCISTAYLTPAGQSVELRLKSFAGDDEHLLLTDFAQMLQKYHDHFPVLCGHNIKEFDVPFIGRRCLIHGIPLPPQINIQGRKPWEVLHQDTLELWKFGDYKHFVSLDLLCAIFEIPTPKSDMSGADVARVYYEEEGGLDRIRTYCEQDVIAVAKLMMRMKNLPLISDSDIQTR